MTRFKSDVYCSRDGTRMVKRGTTVEGRTVGPGSDENYQSKTM